MGRSKVAVLHSRGMPEKICPSCKERLPLTFFARDKSKSDDVTSHCKKCRNLQKQHSRALGLYKNSERRYRRSRDPVKDYAKEVVRRFVAAGLKKPEECEICSGKGRLEAHHPDYSKPLNFKWLCKRCHAYIHRNDS